MATVDEAVRRVLRVKFALGLFEHPYARGTEVTQAVDAHRPLARRAAEESFVLLKNGGAGQAPVLPLSSAVKKIALIGPLADDASEMQGAWGGAQHLPDVVTLRSGLAARMKKLGGELLYAKGTDVLTDAQAGFAAAEQAAAQADVVVMALGESSSMVSGLAYTWICRAASSSCRSHRRHRQAR
jgi:beta-glucosidase